MLKCYNYEIEESIWDDKIEGKDQAEAATVFKEKTRFCLTCLPIEVNVEFTFVDIEQLPYNLS